MFPLPAGSRTIELDQVEKENFCIFQTQQGRCTNEFRDYKAGTRLAQAQGRQNPAWRMQGDGHAQLFQTAVPGNGTQVFMFQAKHFID